MGRRTTNAVGAGLALLLSACAASTPAADARQQWTGQLSERPCADGNDLACVEQWVTQRADAPETVLRATLGSWVLLGAPERARALLQRVQAAPDTIAYVVGLSRAVGDRRGALRLVRDHAARLPDAQTALALARLAPPAEVLARVRGLPPALDRRPLAAALIERGELQAAWTLLGVPGPGEAELGPTLRAALAVHHARAGRPEQARGELQATPVLGGVAHARVARALAGEGARDAALALLAHAPREKASDRRAVGLAYVALGAPRRGLALAEADPRLTAHLTCAWQRRDAQGAAQAVSELERRAATQPALRPILASGCADVTAAGHARVLWEQAREAGDARAQRRALVWLAHAGRAGEAFEASRSLVSLRDAALRDVALAAASQGRHDLALSAVAAIQAPWSRLEALAVTARHGLATQRTRSDRERQLLQQLIARTRAQLG